MTLRLTFVAVALSGLTSATSVAAQDERVFQPGELVKPGGGQTLKILQCRPEKVSREIQCEYVLWKNGGAASIAGWMMASEIAAGEARVKDAERLAALTDTPAPVAAPAPAAPVAGPAPALGTPAPAPAPAADPEEAPLPPPPAIA